MQLFYKKIIIKNQAKLMNKHNFKMVNIELDHNKYNMDTMNLIADDLAGLNLT